jgi:hypothetical protein
LYKNLFPNSLLYHKFFRSMTDFEFTALAEQDKIRVLSHAYYLATSEEAPAMLFLVDHFFVEVICDIDGNLLTTITYSSSSILPDQYLDLVNLSEISNRLR